MSQGLVLLNINYHPIKSNIWTTLPPIHLNSNVFWIYYVGTNVIQYMDRWKIYSIKSKRSQTWNKVQVTAASLRRRTALNNIIWILCISAMKPHEIQEKLGLTRIRDRNWYVQPSCATSGDGLYEGLTWLTSNHKLWAAE